MDDCIGLQASGRVSWVTGVVVSSIGRGRSGVKESSPQWEELLLSML